MFRAFSEPELLLQWLGPDNLNGFKQAGIAIGPGQQPPSAVPDGVVAVVGYANRILIAAYIGWLLFVSNVFLKTARTRQLSAV